MAAPSRRRSDSSPDLSNAPPPPPPPVEAAPVPWRLLPTLGLCWLIPYAVLYMLPIPDLGVVAWFGHAVLGIAAPIEDVATGSGDTLFHWVRMAFLMALSTLACMLWSAFARRPRNYDRAHYWLRAFLRYSLAVTLMGYGFAKVFKAQFPDLMLLRLVQPIGEASPMGLVWTFMGHSMAYNVFTGGAEVLAGLLLWWRRTTTLGALVAIGVMTHVAMLNLCYDIPVKQFSLHLVLFAIVLVSRDARRVIDLLVRNRPTAAVELAPMLTGRWTRRLRGVLKYGVLALALGGSTFMGWTTMTERSEIPPLYGLYEVEDFQLDGEPRPPLLTDEQRWRRVIVDRHGVVLIQRMDDHKDWFKGTVDASTQTLALEGRDDDGEPTHHELSYRETEGGLHLEGQFDGHDVRAEVQAVDVEQFELVRRGFHWVSERPYNR